MKDYWPTDGTQHHEIDRKRLYTNSSIDNFLDNESLWVIIASKGMGKTLLLRTKRTILSRKTEGSVIIPENEEYDIPKLQGSVPTYGYEDIDVWENIWKSSIVFSILNYNHSLQKLDAKEVFWDYLEELEIDSNFKNLLVISIIENKKNNPSYFLNELMKRQVSTLRKFFKSFNNLSEIISKYIKSEFIILIDAFDQTLTSHFSNNIETWKNGQLGLVKASHNLNINNRHIKVYITIRQEAFAGFIDDDSEVIKGSSLMLDYEQYELKLLFEKAIRTYSKSNSLDSFFSLKEIHYDWCNHKEDLFNYVYRHSTLSPRSIIGFGSAIDKIGLKNLDNITAEQELRKVVNKVGADKLYNDYLLGQKKIFLNTLDSENDIRKLFSLIPSNVLKGKTLKTITEKFAHLTQQKVEDCHPFCELFNIGLLGKVGQKGFPIEQVQTFKKPYEFDWGKCGIIKDKSIYLIHPSLQDAIMLERDYYYLNPYNIIGEGKKWEKFKDKRIFPLLFISHSSIDKPVIESFLPKLEQEIDLNIPCDFWYDAWNIKVGGNIHQEVEKGVNESDFVIVFISKNSLKSGWVEREWRRKHYEEIEKNKIQVIAIIIDDTSPSELPSFLKGKKALILNEFSNIEEMLNILSNDISEYIIDNNSLKV